MKINVLKAIREYEDEQIRLSEEMMEQEAMAPISVHTEGDYLWDCWFRFAPMYEPECDKDLEEDGCTEQEIKLSYNMPGKNRAKRAERRKATAKHKKKLSRNAVAIWANYGERMGNDMHNWSFQKLKNGEHRANPKFKTDKSDEILKKAMKLNVLPKELRDDIAKHMEWVAEFGKRNIAGQLQSDRYHRECEEKVKRELDQLVKDNINIFVQRTSLERELLLNRKAA